jgi:hypothetical protein
MAAWGYLDIEFKKIVGEQETIPSLADTTSSKKGWRWKKGDYTINQRLRELTPYPGVHPSIGDSICNISTTSPRGESVGEV